MSLKKLNILPFVIYVLSLCIFQLHLFHPLDEHNHFTSHECSEQAQLNPCHLSNHHFNYKNGCSHTLHFDAFKKNCNTCDLMAKEPFYLSSSFALNGDKSLTFYLNGFYSTPFLSGKNSKSVSDRGPPYSS